MRGARTVGAAALAVAALVAPLVATGTAEAGPDRAAPSTARHGMSGMSGMHTFRAGHAGRQVRAARAATRGFTHTHAARAAGFGLLKDADGIACIAMKGMGGMGVHYVKGSRVDGRIRLRRPEALVYRFTTNGHLRLSALEYLVTRPAWREHHATGRPELFGHRFDLTPKANRFGLPAYFSLHAWVWHPNPAGRFRMWNPSVFCPRGI